MCHINVLVVNTCTYLHVCSYSLFDFYDSIIHNIFIHHHNNTLHYNWNICIHIHLQLAFEIIN